MTDDEDSLEEWVQGVQPTVMHLEVYQVPREVTLDFSPESLRRLEEIALDRVDDVDDLDHEDEQGFVDGAVAYVGETLMRVAGGAWAWDSGSPVAEADARLGLAPVSPRRLLKTAIERRDGGQLSAVASAWSRAVAELAARCPSWHPVKQPTPGLDPPNPAGSAALDHWLEERGVGFAAWVARYAPDGTWDFSPESLDALEALVRRTAPSEEAFQDPARRDFAEGASWYLGEVMRRGIGGRWRYQEDELDPSTGAFLLNLLGSRIPVITPSVYLRIAIARPGFLRERYIMLSTT